MSLKFTFKPPKGVRFVRWQKISFTASKPFIHFCLHDTAQIKDKPILRSRSFADWHAYLSALYEKGIYPELFRIDRSMYKGKQINDFRQILNNISEGHYTDVEQVREDINTCLMTVYENFTSVELSNYRDAAYDAKVEIDSSYDSCESSSRLHTTRLTNAITNFANLQIPEINAHNGSEFNINEFAKFLNDRPIEDKIKAEWLIRIKSPRLSFTMNQVDLAELPLETIRTLANYFGYKMVSC